MSPQAQRQLLMALTLDLVSEGGTVTVNGTPVTTADVMASNGVIHVIDSVLVPESVDVSAL